MADEPNSVALKLPGNYLEVAAAVSVVDSTHNKNASKSFRLAGVDGLQFLENLIANLDNCCNSSEEMSVRWPEIKWLVR